jgi:hypothetical protein
MRLSWKDVGIVFIVALILDAIYQIVVHAGIFTLELLITATVLALVPYMVVRDLVARVAKWVVVGNLRIVKGRGAAIREITGRLVVEDATFHSAVGTS